MSNGSVVEKMLKPTKVHIHPFVYKISPKVNQVIDTLALCNSPLQYAKYEHTNPNDISRVWDQPLFL